MTGSDYASLLCGFFLNAKDILNKLFQVQNLIAHTRFVFNARLFISTL